MIYKSKPKSKDTPSRKTRKTQRNTVFQYNKRLHSARSKREEKPKG